jgi:hypothetical protein
VSLDENKVLPLASTHDFVGYLCSGLLLAADHPRAGLADEKQAWL